MSDLTTSHNRPGRYDDEIKAYFSKTPSNVNKPLAQIAKDLGIGDYRTIKRFYEKYVNDEMFERMKNGNFVELPTFITPDAQSQTSQNEEGYSKVPEKDILTFENYCRKYHIPADKVTSAKFVNHQGQAAWNAVVDFTRISEAHLNEYFEKLKSQVAREITPVEIKQIGAVTDPIAYHMYYSDKHVGAETRSNAIYQNVWNAEVFRNRLMTSLEDLKHTAKYFGKIDKLLIGDLGDSVDGWNGKTTRNSNHSLPQNMDNKETFDVYVGVMMEFFETLISLELANEYEFICTSNDNHGGDFSYIVNRSVEVWLNVKYPEIKTHIGKQFIEEYKYGQHAFLLTHGKDEEDMRSGLPLNLTEKVEKWFDDYIINNRLLDFNCHVIKGDLHQEALNYGKRIRYRNVLSLYGSSAWMMTNFGSGKAGMSNELVWKNHNKIMPSLVELKDIC